METQLDRFYRLYTASAEGQRAWENWMTSIPEANRTIMERVAADQAEAQGIPVGEMQQRLAVQKVIEDRGTKFITKFLAEQDAATRTLKPMALGKKKR
jgi:hypothetical protein